MCLDISNVDPAFPVGTSIEHCFESEVVEDVLAFGGICGDCPDATPAPTPAIPEGCDPAVPCTRELDGLSGIEFCFELPDTTLFDLCIDRGNVERALELTGPTGGCGSCSAVNTPIPTSPPNTPPPDRCSDVIPCLTQTEGAPGVYMCFVDEVPELTNSFCVPNNLVLRALDAGGFCGGKYLKEAE